MTNKKNFITVRITDEEAAFLDIYCKEFKLSRSDLVRRAVTQMTFLFPHQSTNILPHMIINQGMFRQLLETQSDKEIKALATLSYQIGLNDNIVDKEINIEQKSPSVQEALAYHIHMLTEYVFPIGGQNWFDKVHHHWVNDHLYFHGFHRMGHKYALFIQYLLECYANRYKYTLNQAHLEEGFVELQFSPFE
jgi:hypothetical protein